MFSKKKPTVAEPSGQLGDLNEYQDDILSKFKEWYAQNHGRLNPWFTDQYLLRFCRARKFDLDKIILMFDNFMKMRAELGIDGMLETYEYPEAAEVAKHYPRGYYGVDKIGRPIYIDCSGRLSVTGVLQNTTEERFWMDMYMSYERLLKLQFLSCSVLYDRQILQTMSIIDMKGFHLGMWNKQTTGFVKKASKIAQDFYPEIMGKMIVTNAPAIFTGIYSLIKGWIDEKTRKKISLVGNPIKILTELCDLDHIPVFLGGKSERPLTDCFGPWEEYDLVDSADPDAVVGIKRKEDPVGKIFTPHDSALLENPLILGAGESGTKGAMISKLGEKAQPYSNANKSTPIEEEIKADMS